MELKLMRVSFPGSTMGQLYKEDQLLCIYIGWNEKKGWTPIAHLPDGRYSLRKPRTGNEDWDLQLIFNKSRKPLLMDFKKLSQQEMKGYEDAPLYLSFGDGQNLLSELARRNVRQVIEAIRAGDRVYLTISSKIVA